MTASIDRDGDFARIRTALGDFEAATGLAEAAFERLAREGDDGSGTGRARVTDVLARRAGVEADLVGFTVRFEAETGSFASAFEALKAGRSLTVASQGFLRRRKSVAGDEAEGLLPLLAGVGASLVQADQALRLLIHLAAVLKRCHAGAEATLEDIVARRRVALAGLEAAQKGSEEQRPPLTALRLRLAGSADDAARAPLEEESRRLQADLKAAQDAERECLAKYRALDDLAALLDLYMAALNGQLAAGNAVVAKLSSDVERCVLLGRALQTVAGSEGGAFEVAEAPLRAIDPAGPVGRLLALAEKGWLSHAETMRRKDHADAAFSVRFGEGERVQPSR